MTSRIASILLLSIFAVISFHAPLSVLASTYFIDQDLIIKSWKEIFMLLALPLIVAIAYRKKLIAKLWQDALMKFITIFAGLHFASFFLYYSGVSSLAGLLIDLRFLFFFILIYTLITCYPHLRRIFISTALAAAGLVMIFGLLQVTVLPKDILESIGYGENTIQPYLTVDKNQDYIRINSTLRGPNPLGIYAAVLLALLLSFLLKQKKRIEKKWWLLGLAAISSLVLWNTYSRSSLLAAIAGVVIITVAEGRKKQARKWTVAGIIILFFVGVFAVMQNSTLLSQVVFHDNPNGGSVINSDDEHASSLSFAIGEVVKNPLGVGIGSTGSASLFSDQPYIVESQYLFIAHEVGIIGLGVYLLIFGLMMIRLWRAREDWLSLGIFASGIGIAIACLVLPVFADDTVGILWWGLAAIALASHKKIGKNHAKKT